MINRPPFLRAEVCEQALNARDARFDGIFFVGITTTRVYCRPVCPARVSYRDHRRFFPSASSAERAGFRPCLRCRPELAPGRALVDAVPRLARVAAHRIGAGALNGSTVADLARELEVSERHLRRALEREIGVSPVELAQTHRLLLAKRLLTDTTLPVTRIAFASGFQSLRRFNSVFRERYRLSPSALRRSNPAGGSRQTALRPTDANGLVDDLVRLTLAYRAPLAWDVLIALLGMEALPGVELVIDGRYCRTVRLDGKNGIVFVENAATASNGTGRAARNHLNVDVSPSLLPALMPLLARLRQLFDLDAEPAVVDSHLAANGLGGLVGQHRGLRIPGAFDGFETAFRTLLGRRLSHDVARRIVCAIGEPIDTGIPGLGWLAPTAARVSEAGASGLSTLGVPPRRACAVASVAHAIVAGKLRLEPGSSVSVTHRALVRMAGISDRLATAIVMRTLYWPDAFPVSDRALQDAAGTDTPGELRILAEKWRPWRAYAALHLRLDSGH